MKQLANIRELVTSWKDLHGRVLDALALAELEDESLRTELTLEVEDIEALIEQHELDTLLSGKYDAGDALLAIHAGAGGTDAHDWAEMLQRMYLRWAENRGYQTELLDLSVGEEAGIKSVTVAVNGHYAYGYLRPEKGVHRLVQLSPFDAAHRRHTKTQ